MGSQDGTSQSAEARAAVARGGRRGPIHPAMTVRQVATDYPECRDLLARLGEPERPGVKFGHLEPIDRFALRHGMAPAALLDQLARAAGVLASWENPSVQTAHRPFIAAALALTLTLGAGWGVLLLLQIGQAGSFGAVSAASIVAHGEAQLWGFIGLFVMGVALAHLPVTTASPRAPRWQRLFILVAMLCGVIGGFAWSMAPALLPWLGPASASALLAGACGFFLFVWQEVKRKLDSVWARCILASPIWMIIWAAVDLALRTRLRASGPALFSTADRQLLMELAIFGFALNAIYGFGQKLLPGLLGTGTTKQTMFHATFLLHQVGVALLVLGVALGQSWLGLAGTLAICAGAAAFAVGLRGLRKARRSQPRPEAGPPLLGSYIQLAFFWLALALLMLAGGQVAILIAGAAPAHAYSGAVRHILTVGFMTTLIMGVAQRLLPIMSHRLLAWPRLVTPIFALVACGNLLRFLTELGTLQWESAYVIMPLSGLLELTALALFAANLVHTMWPGPDYQLRKGHVTARTLLGKLLAEYPWLEDRLIEEGLGYLARVRGVPAELTLGSFATGEGADPDTIATRVNHLLREHLTAAAVGRHADSGAAETPQS